MMRISSVAPCKALDLSSFTGVLTRSKAEPGTPFLSCSTLWSAGRSRRTAKEVSEERQLFDLLRNKLIQDKSHLLSLRSVGARGAGSTWASGGALCKISYNQRVVSLRDFFCSSSASPSAPLGGAAQEGCARPLLWIG